jgi:hypothetical protein
VYIKYGYPIEKRYESVKKNALAVALDQEKLIEKEFTTTFDRTDMKLS